jgi:NADH:ubiquinone oxidoreductase subunit 6 (subunit J)
MLAAFIITALVTLLGGVATMVLRNLIHCALALTVTFAGLAAAYLELGAQFVGFVQILVYVGAVAILIVFAVLLTRGNEPASERVFSMKWPIGAAIALAVFGVFAGVLLSSRALPPEPAAVPSATVRQIGDQLMTRYVVPLEVLGLLLTAALIGAVILAMPEKQARPNPPVAP